MANVNSVEIKARKLGFDAASSRQIRDRIHELQSLSVKGVDRLIKKLTSAPDKDTFRDYWLEGTYSHVFAVNNLPVELEPCGNKGPDFVVVVDSSDVFVEIRNIRQINIINNLSVRRVASTLQDKLSQTVENEINLIILISGKLFSESSFYRAIYSCRDSCYKSVKLTRLWPNLSGVIIDMPYYDSARQKPIYSRFLRSSTKKTSTRVLGAIKQCIRSQAASKLTFSTN